MLQTRASRVPPKILKLLRYRPRISATETPTCWRYFRMTLLAEAGRVLPRGFEMIDRTLVRGAIAGAFFFLISVIPALAAPGDPAAFVRQLYALPNLWSDVTADDASEAKYLTPHLIELVKANNQLDEADRLDYDPLADAQDFEITDVQPTVTASDDKTATVDLKFHNLGDELSMTLELEVVDGTWHLANIHYDEERSLSDDLEFMNDSE